MHIRICVHIRVCVQTKGCVVRQGVSWARREGVETIARRHGHTRRCKRFLNKVLIVFVGICL
jgi:hypothetical protein